MPWCCDFLLAHGHCFADVLVYPSCDSARSDNNGLENCQESKMLVLVSSSEAAGSVIAPIRQRLARCGKSFVAWFWCLGAVSSECVVTRRLRRISSLVRGPAETGECLNDMRMPSTLDSSAPTAVML